MSDDTAGRTYRQELEVPSQRHLDLYRLLRANARRDQTGRLVSWWPQAKLARRLGVSVRTLRNLLADLREPGSDPRHPTSQPPGLRLGLVKVEPSYYRNEQTGRYRLGGNLYVITDDLQAKPQVRVQTPSVRQQATQKQAVSPAHTYRQEDAVACLNKGKASQLQVGGSLQHHRPTTGNPETSFLVVADHAPEVSAAQLAGWLSAHGLGGAQVLGEAPNAWVDRQTRAGLRAWHRTLAGGTKRRRR